MTYQELAAYLRLEYSPTYGGAEWRDDILLVEDYMKVRPDAMTGIQIFPILMNSKGLLKKETLFLLQAMESNSDLQLLIFLLLFLRQYKPFLQQR